ncbi:ferredoxin-thioredoxin reductase, variable chain, chloroplastic-like [Telopea speciosissima]|uniref:ferredoxin-thioredoxin reductase, variable chain, chloroplastic-like n=1 Tax=Telopea speciosissima TaxID=54955 RepID=UPI001CC408E2|nr:ferredoxin-thioredoxin reductase, variable chain, chloroplastic-like [Telopea speciosissima]XP_043702854.1 ferredoxin-thioredoxin reductase, variable chain, chloroplastic-like [Telopea speciosissima]
MMMSPLASPTSFAHPNTMISSINTSHHPRATLTVNSSIFSVSLRGGDLTTGKLRRERKISCEVALKLDSSTVDSSSCSSSSSSLNLSSAASTAGEEDEESSRAKIGARVRVKAPLKVYHVPKVPELDVTGMEGKLKQYVGLWKGKRISANLPFKVEFVTEIEGRGTVKFFTHLKEDEFEYVDDNRD